MSQSDWRHIISLARDDSLDRISTIYPEQYIKYYLPLRKIAKNEKRRRVQESIRASPVLPTKTVWPTLLPVELQKDEDDGVDSSDAADWMNELHAANPFY